MTAHPRRYLDARVGDVMPADGPEPHFGAPCEPAWYLLVARPQRERRLADWLREEGHEGWYPVETRRRLTTRLPRDMEPAARRKALASGAISVSVEYPMVAGYVFARLSREPRWHMLREHRHIAAVVTHDGHPLVIPEEALERMEQMPEALAEARRAEAERHRVQPGKRARIVGGAMDGWQVDVSRIDGALAYFILPLLGGREVSAPVDAMRRVGD